MAKKDNKPGRLSAQALKTQTPKTPTAPKSPNERRVTVTSCPEYHPRKIPWIRLRGQWLQHAGFNLAQTVRVRVMDGCIVITTD